MLIHNIYSVLLFSLLVILLGLIIYRVIKARKSNLPLMQFIENNLFLGLIVLVLTWNQFYIISLESERGWYERFNKTIFPLTGVNVEIVPPHEIGYVIDSSYDSRMINGNMFPNVCIKSLNVKNDEIFHVSLYCYVSKDFNGDSVKIIVKGANNENRESSYRLFDSYKINPNPTQNLIYNGNFGLGTTNWVPWADSTTHSIIETPFGKGIRVSRTNGDGGYWSLRYIGRPIIYYAKHRYQLRFNYMIRKGNEMPFKVGWWVSEEGQNNSALSLPLSIRNINLGWKEATCSYEFNETHYDLPTFLNSLQDYSVVDIANVEMTDLNRNDTIPYYVDQLNVKGTWQKLTIDFPCDLQSVSFYISISKNGVKDIRSMRGYVIFTKPEYKFEKEKENI
jgi:hypothetical protein